MTNLLSCFRPYSTWVPGIKEASRLTSHVPLLDMPSPWFCVLVGIIV